MDALTFIAILCCLGVVLVWHWRNEAKGSPGEKGLLAMRPADPSADARSYALKQGRLARRGRSTGTDAPQTRARAAFNLRRPRRK